MTSPQNAVVANRLLSRGGAHFAQIPWHAGYDTPYTKGMKSLMYNLLLFSTAIVNS